MIVAQQNNITVLDVNTEIDTTHLIVPESFELGTHNLMADWYINRYTVTDNSNSGRADAVFEDQDYIDRLQRLPTTIEMPYNSVVKSFIKLYVERRKELVERILALRLYYGPMIDDIIDRNGLPMELSNLAVIESSLNPNAVSKAGATGMWQFMSSTATGEGLEVNSLVDERRDPVRSTEAAAKYLNKLYNIYGDWALAIAAYNCGPGNVNKAIRKAGGDTKDYWLIYNYLPAETRTYVPAFIAANYVMSYYKDHNISPVLAKKPIRTESVDVNKRVHFQQISDVLGIPIEEIRALNPQYRQDIIPGDIKPYKLVLPHMQTQCFVAYEDSIVNHNAHLYARRDVVEPGVSTRVIEENGEYYVVNSKVVYHKVKSGESLSAIANKYGVTQQEVIRANGGRKTLKRGKTLAINVVERRVATDQEKANAIANGTLQVATVTAADSTAVATTPTAVANNDTTAVQTTVTELKPDTVAQPVAAEETKPVTPATPKPEPVKPKTTTYVVKKGDNLFKIATKNGITVDELKKANNLKSDNIQAGQKLKIPAKSTTSTTTTRRRRR